MAAGRILDQAEKVELDSLISNFQWYPLTSAQAEGKPLHHFVRGLIFSSTIVDLVDEHLPNGYHAGWGQIVDRLGGFLSSENDIIVYSGRPEKTWKTSSLRYVLVRDENAHLVIQCRAVVKTVDAELRKYARHLSGFSCKLWLLAEACWAKTRNRVQQVTKDAKRAGYERFYYLYDYTGDDSGSAPNYAGWTAFRNAIRAFGHGQKSGRKKKRRKRRS